MKIQDVMAKNVIKIHPNEPVEVAARLLTHYNIGMLPACAADGSICGVVTDRDLVTRWLAPGRALRIARVGDVMTEGVITASPEMELSVAAHLMGRQQVRRLPVLDRGKLVGMVSLSDLAAAGETVIDAAEALSQISRNVSDR